MRRSNNPKQRNRPLSAKPNSAADFEQRNKRYQSVAQQSLLNFQPRGGPNNNAANMPATCAGHSRQIDSRRQSNWA